MFSLICWKDEERLNNIFHRLTLMLGLGSYDQLGPENIMMLNS